MAYSHPVKKQMEGEDIWIFSSTSWSSQGNVCLYICRTKCKHLLGAETSELQRLKGTDEGAGSVPGVSLQVLEQFFFSKRNPKKFMMDG